MGKSKFYQIKNITEHEYTLVGCDGSVITHPIQDVDKSASAFTIQDAKDGDVLAMHAWAFIYNGNRGGGSCPGCYCGINTLGNFKVGVEHHWTGKPVFPATKEQRDTLFAKMKEAGYAFDFEKKELKKLGQPEVTKTSDQEEIAEIPFGAKDSELQEAIYNIPKGFHAEINDDKVVIKKGEKPAAWSEEDIRNIQDIDSVLFYDKDLPEETCMRLRNWLKSLKPNKDMVEALRTEYEKGRADTIAEMEKDWSEEDEVKINRIVACLENLNVADNDILLKDVDWLKSLKDRVIPKPKHEWSIEDERTIAIINNALTESNTPPDDYDKVYDWLESIKQRIGWKPSNAQIEALEHFVRSIGEGGYASPYDNNTKLLYSLLEQLKKLKA